MKIPRLYIALTTTGVLILSVVTAAPLNGGAAVARASTTVLSPGVVPAGGTSTAPASFTFQENSPGAWHAGGTISVVVADSAGDSTLTFTNTNGGPPMPTITAPAALGASITAVGGDSLTVSITGDDGVNALAFTVGNVFITAAIGAASGPIRAETVGSIDPSTYGPVNFASSVTDAVGLLAQSYPADATSMVVNVQSSCGFADVGTPTSQNGVTFVAGHFVIAGQDAGPTGTVDALGGEDSDQEILSGFTPLTRAVTAGQAVTQANVPDCPSARIALIALAVAATPSTIQPGEQTLFTYTVRNPGEVPLANVTVADGACSPVRYVSGDTNGDGLLERGETWTYTCAVSPAATTTDSASALGTANGRTTVATAQATVTVTPATVQPPPALVASGESSSTGVTQTGPFTISTKVVQKGQYITLKITTSPAMAGADIGIWVAKKVNGKWTKFSPHTGRHADGNGVVYYYYKAGSIAWLSFQAHFYGNATHAPSVSNAVQARWT